MSNKPQSFDNGIRLRPTSRDGNRDGEIWVNEAGDTLQIYLDGNIQSFVTEAGDIVKSPSGMLFVDGAQGNDISNSGSQEQPFATIQKAIDEAIPYTIIQITSGTYNENLDFSGKDTIALQSNFRKHQTTAIGPETVIIGKIDLINCNHIFLTDLTVNFTDDGSGDAAINVEPGVDFTTYSHAFKDMSIVGVGTFGIRGTGDNGAIVVDSTGITGGIDLPSTASAPGIGWFFRDNCNIGFANLNVGENRAITIRSCRNYATINQTGGRVRLMNLVVCGIINSTAGADSIADTANAGATGLYIMGGNMTYGGQLTFYNAISIGPNVKYAIDGTVRGGRGVDSIDGAAVRIRDKSPDADTIRFDNSGNGFSAVDVQGAIEEAATTGGGTVSELSDLTDVTLTGVNNGDALIYNSTSQIFEPGTISSGPTTIDLGAGSTLDWTAGDLFNKTTTTNLNLTFSNETDKTIVLAVTNTSGSAITTTLPGTVRKRADMSLTVEANSTTVYTFVRISGIVYVTEITELV